MNKTVDFEIHVNWPCEKFDDGWMSMLYGMKTGVTLKIPTYSEPVFINPGPFVTRAEVSAFIVDNFKERNKDLSSTEKQIKSLDDTARGVGKMNKPKNLCGKRTVFFDRCSAQATKKLANEGDTDGLLTVTKTSSDFVEGAQ